jgi:iron uptake system component EfeO
MMRMAPRRGLLAGLAVALCAGILAACGNDGDSEGSEEATSALTGQPASLSAEQEAAVEDYRAFAVENAEQHVEGFGDFADAVEAGEIERAKAIYPEARMPWERIEPVAGLFGDLDPALDARAGDVPKETWGGWHYFEKKLWIDESTSGLDPYIAETEADARKLVEVAETIEMTANDVATGSVELLNEVSSSKITGEEERYSHTDLWDFQANVEGSEAAFDAVVPLVSDQQLVDEIQGRFAELFAELDAHRRGQGFVTYTEVTEPERRELSRLIDALAEPLSEVGSQLES